VVKLKKLTIAVTSYKEPFCIGRCLDSITSQRLPEDYEIIVSCPDDPTVKVVHEYMKKNKRIKLIRDEGIGKPNALNHIFKEAKGRIIVLTDGDVILQKNSISNLLKHFDDPKIGAVSGSIIFNYQDSILDPWFKMTRRSMDKINTEESNSNDFFNLVGNLYALRRGIVKKIPKYTFVDDILIGLLIKRSGYRILFEPDAKVMVKTPAKVMDFLRQVIRVSAGLNQIKIWYGVSSTPKIKLSAFFKEIFRPNKMKDQLSILTILFLYILASVYGLILIKSNASFSKIWTRTPSAK
jgi:cellulose synthase/poly-beta-1,6-N-acetylglucosamine synthase-like glycosyltransferase